MTLVPGSEPAVNAPLPFNTYAFSEDELKQAINALKSKKATKEGDVPAEVLKTLFSESQLFRIWLLEFCNKCWIAKSGP